VIADEALDVTTLIETITLTQKNLEDIKNKLNKYPIPNSTETIYKLVSELAKEEKQ